MRRRPEPEEDEDASGFCGMDASATEPPDIGDLPEDDPDDGFDFLTRDDEDEEYEDGEDEDEDEDGDGEDELLPLFSWACTCTRDSREMCRRTTPWSPRRSRIWTLSSPT